MIRVDVRLCASIEEGVHGVSFLCELGFQHLPCAHCADRHVLEAASTDTNDLGASKESENNATHLHKVDILITGE